MRWSHLLQMLSVYQVPTQSQCVTSRYKTCVRLNSPAQTQHIKTGAGHAFYTCYQCIKSQHSHSVLPPDTKLVFVSIPQCKCSISKQALITHSTHVVSVSNRDTDHS